MKLSDAIRLGAMLRPQVRGDYFFAGGSCAMGAAAEACGIVSSRDPRLLAFEEKTRCDLALLLCPACGAPSRTGTNVVIHLNDLHHWTREQIADWVETVEPKDAPVPVSPALDAVDRHLHPEGTSR